jgi:hypothetical protein
VVLITLLTACRPTLPEPAEIRPTQETQPAETLPVDAPTSSTPVPPPTVTEQPSPARLIFYAPEQSDPRLVQEIEEALRGAAAGNDFYYERVLSLTAQDLDANVRLVASLPGNISLTSLVNDFPEIQFLAIGITGLKAGNNLSVIGGEGFRGDYLGFTAGYLAVVITPDWRVAAISGASSEESSFRQGFESGGIFFCGLCRQVYPPFYDSEGQYINYPLSLELPAGSSPEAAHSEAAALINRGVKTVFVTPGAADPVLIQFLADEGMILIGTTQPPEGLSSRWAATVRYSVLPVLNESLDAILAGQGGANLPLSLVVENVNPKFVSRGRLSNVEEIAANLIIGYIGSGWEP